MNKDKGLPWAKLGMAALELVVLAAILYLVLRDHYREILADIHEVGLFGLLPLLAAGMGYVLLDALACRELLRSGLPGLTYREALEVTFMGIFCNVATFSAGILPTQGIYLHRRGMEPGDSLGLLIMKYVLHKGAILVFSGALLLADWDRLTAGGGELKALALYGWGACAAIVVFLLLLCTWDKIRRAAAWAVGRLPSTEKWARRRESLTRNLNALYAAARTLSHEKKRLWTAFLLNVLKLISMYSVPFLALSAMGERRLTWGLTLSMTGFSHLVAGVLPNVAGMGPAEAAFLWVFSPFLPGAEASSALMLYRFATYFFPFLVSVVVMAALRRRDRRQRR